MVSFGAVHDVLASFRIGSPVLIVDEERENEGDVAVAAEHVTPAVITFMATFARGLVCMPMTGERLDELEIPLMVEGSVGIESTAFTVSVDARAGTTTGISAYDRAATVRTLIDPFTRPSDLVRPGHLFPLRGAQGGVLRRQGHTEAAIDLARLAGLYPAATICEVMNDDGTMAAADQLTAFARRHSLLTIRLSDIVDYRLQTEGAVALTARLVAR
jgi:3,4-dihydroxy 2-butanone 4-phosphate synthase/GTP cyclohydrolase II